MIKRAPIYYYNMYAPHRIFRRWLSTKIYYWADNKYGVNARSGMYPFTKNDIFLQTKWFKWMRVKNFVNNRIGKTLK